MTFVDVTQCGMVIVIDGEGQLQMGGTLPPDQWPGLLRQLADDLPALWQAQEEGREVTEDDLKARPS